MNCSEGKCRSFDSAEVRFAQDDGISGGWEWNANAGSSTPLKYASLRMTASVGVGKWNANAGPSTPLKYASLRMTNLWGY
jgi:hypothetical protein